MAGSWLVRHMHLPRHMAKTGENCERSGLYLASGQCGHATQHAHRTGEEFPSCRVCSMPVHWTLLREFFAPDAEIPAAAVPVR